MTTKQDVKQNIRKGGEGIVRYLRATDVLECRGVAISDATKQEVDEEGNVTRFGRVNVKVKINNNGKWVESVMDCHVAVEQETTEAASRGLHLPSFRLLDDEDQKLTKEQHAEQTPTVTTHAPTGRPPIK